MTALYREHHRWNRTRDFFPAQFIADGRNKVRTKQSDKVYSAEEILLFRYPKERVIITHDPDHGAAGNWTQLKQTLKGRTKTQLEKRAALKPHHG